MNTADGPSWSDIASWYDDLLEAGSGPHQTALACLLELTPSLADEVVLDLACGTGLATRAIAESGAQRVVGVDYSASMIELAEGHGGPQGRDVTYLVDDAQQLRTLRPHTFDGVTCQLGLMDIPDLDSTLASIKRVLKTDGWFVFVIAHPCFLVPDARPIARPDGRPAVEITGYFEQRFWRSTNPSGVRRAGNYHRPLSTYLNALTRAGFALEHTDEPAASGLPGSQQPLYREVPIFFGARTRRH